MVPHSHRITRVGGNRPLQLDLRFIAATNKDLKRAVALAEGDTVILADLPPDLQELAPGGNGCWPTLEAQERDYIQKVLAFTNHQTGESARILDLPRTTLWRKMKKYGLSKT